MKLLIREAFVIVLHYVGLAKRRYIGEASVSSAMVNVFGLNSSIMFEFHQKLLILAALNFIRHGV